ncbi:hypothetical protein LTR37_005749 [Vermiconidia calcicola]|uniref:Uncharacterized protein n=1 Tax=Vermiconidia calcicola TaxID=1690605 RepID=A0ACC3NKA1_9PEZI|nr:hypothetical protein LTR37_005749 [Vermiconidia calcicola]
MGCLNTVSSLPADRQWQENLELHLGEEAPNDGEECLEYGFLMDGSQVYMSRPQNLQWSPHLAALILAGLSFVAVVWHANIANLASPSPSHASTHGLFHSSAALDVVVARYDEPALDVARHIIEVLDVPNIRRLAPTIRIYDKGAAMGNSSAFEVDLQNALSAALLNPKIVFTMLPNIGRESETFLHHITTRWDNLANHTLFMQADVHYGPKKYTRRIQDYFVPSTGFLSLAKVGGYCSSCDRCHDRDWTEEPELLQEIYSDFNGGVGCRDVVLTERGQFIASAARVRGNKNETYQRWLQELRDPQSRLHTAPYTESATSRKKDSLSAPRVGFTFERSWGVMLQCNEKRISDRCPSLLSGLVRPSLMYDEPTLEDCQCLDPQP